MEKQHGKEKRRHCRLFERSDYRRTSPLDLTLSSTFRLQKEQSHFSGILME